MPRSSPAVEVGDPQDVLSKGVRRRPGFLAQLTRERAADLAPTACVADCILRQAIKTPQRVEKASVHRGTADRNQRAL